MAEKIEDPEEGQEAEEQAPKSKKKLIIIIVAAVLLLAGIGGGVYFFLFMGEEESAQVSETSSVPTEMLDAAIYVAMPRPFVFNVVDGKRDRLVQIKVQLLVRGIEHATLAKKHTPLLEGTLVRVFSEASVEKLRSPEGKEALRVDAVVEMNASIKKLENVEIIDRVLFTGFVLQ